MKEQLLSTVENSKNYTLQVAGAMPEKGYHFKPAGAGWNFGELMHHIAYGIQWWQDNYVTGNKTGWDPPPTKNNKQEIVAYLTWAYDTLQKTLRQQPLNDQSKNGVHATIDHITHHRGQAVLYLRTNGIEPPEYVY
ncbi:DinB family protein [Niastella caeni]|uniref:DinB family protein n=1 Tax=Niastella caeni TaxID=2569763 RepID=A0A4S8HZG2_9BACT|nr:DinB family protein [Niastella caeni]THU41080.1 DinB family protein [Niastella caeni]